MGPIWEGDFLNKLFGEFQRKNDFLNTKFRSFSKVVEPVFLYMTKVQISLNPSNNDRTILIFKIWPQCKEQIISTLSKHSINFPVSGRSVICTVTFTFVLWQIMSFPILDKDCMHACLCSHFISFRFIS